MIEVRGNLWDYDAMFRVITTNGTIKTNGEVVMGRGCAREARDKFPTLAKELGDRITATGNHVHVFETGIVSFPVKHNWWETADIALIKRSALELMEVADDFGDVLVMADDDIFPFIEPPVYVMPRPGCGNGGLDWVDVKPVIEPILSDQFHVITF